MTRAHLLPLLTLLLSQLGCGAARIRMPGPVDHLAQERSPEELATGWNAAARAEAVAAMQQEVAPRTGRKRRTAPEGEAIARQAARLVGDRSLIVRGERYRADCSGFVAAAYGGAGRALSGSSRDLFERARTLGLLHHRKTPEVGDIAFFDDSYDRDGDGRRNDPLTHVAVVEAVADDGTVVLVHYGGKGVARISMDLRDPHTHVDEAGVLRNSILRTDGKGERLTGELFRAWGSLWRADEGRES